MLALSPSLALSFSLEAFLRHHSPLPSASPAMPCLSLCSCPFTLLDSPRRAETGSTTAAPVPGTAPPVPVPAPVPAPLADTTGEFAVLLLRMMSPATEEVRKTLVGTSAAVSMSDQTVPSPAAMVAGLAGLQLLSLLPCFLRSSERYSKLASPQQHQVRHEFMFAGACQSLHD